MKFFYFFFSDLRGKNNTPLYKTSLNKALNPIPKPSPPRAHTPTYPGCTALPLLVVGAAKGVKGAPYEVPSVMIATKLRTRPVSYMFRAEILLGIGCGLPWANQAYRIAPEPKSPRQMHPSHMPMPSCCTSLRERSDTRSHGPLAKRARPRRAFALGPSPLRFV